MITITLPVRASETRYRCAALPPRKVTAVYLPAAPHCSISFIINHQSWQESFQHLETAVLCVSFIPENTHSSCSLVLLIRSLQFSEERKSADPTFETRMVSRFIYPVSQEPLIYSFERNIVLATQAIANVVKSSFGPSGLDKMMVDDIGDVTVTNDGATILSLLDVEHPAGKILVTLAQQQDKEVLFTPRLDVETSINTSPCRLEMERHQSLSWLPNSSSVPTTSSAIESILLP